MSARSVLGACVARLGRSMHSSRTVHRRVRVLPNADWSTSYLYREFEAGPVRGHIDRQRFDDEHDALTSVNAHLSVGPLAASVYRDMELTEHRVRVSWATRRIHIHVSLYQRGAW